MRRDLLRNLPLVEARIDQPGIVGPAILDRRPTSLGRVEVCPSALELPLLSLRCKRQDLLLLSRLQAYKFLGILAFKGGLQSCTERLNGTSEFLRLLQQIRESVQRD